MRVVNILGLNYGHDAAAAVIRDGRVISYIMRERRDRVKHGMTLSIAVIHEALAEAGITFRDIDYVAITSTQGKELIIDDPARATISFDAADAGKVPCSTVPFFAERKVKVESLLKYDVMKYVFGDEESRKSMAGKVYSALYPESAKRKAEDIKATGWLDDYISHPLWEKGQTLAEIAATNYSELLKTDKYRQGFHYPVTFALDGERKPGFFIHHHMCHAAAVFFQSGYTESAIITHDGYTRPRDYSAGMFYFGKGNKVYPIAPHHLFLGAIYDWTGINLNLALIGAAGKLMGLAPWGKPRFFDRKFLGNWIDYKRNGNPEGEYRQTWWSHCTSQAKMMGYDMTALGDKKRMTDPVNADIAASTQKLFEETLIAAADSLFLTLQKSGSQTANLCLSGGTALNCPANARVWREGKFKNVYVEPACDDSGIPIGAALALYHNVLNQPVTPKPVNYQISPYLGRVIPNPEITDALKKYASQIEYKKLDNVGLTMAKWLADNKVVAWYEGRSEIGPRALGHRSILADPRDNENWAKCNRIKGRELWRPFAPAVLEAEAEKWFWGAPLPSPYMLFTATVKSSDIPAITHMDLSSRLQSVNETGGNYYRLLQEFFKLTGVPVILNTSFNGPGEPIVESPVDALNLFVNSECDVLCLGDYEVQRKTTKKAAATDTTEGVDDE